MRMNIKIHILFYALVFHKVFSFDIKQPSETIQPPDETARGRRDVIEEEKYYNIHIDDRRDAMNHQTPWLPAPAPPEEPTTKISIADDSDQHTTESITDKPTGRGARASNENWIKLPFPNRNDQNDILTPPKPDLINSRMPRVNFVTQNKGLEASESRNDKESVQRPTRTDNLRTDFVRPDEDRAQFKPVFPRQALYYPDDNKPYYDDRYFAPEDLYRRELYDGYDRRNYYPGYVPRVDRYDDGYDHIPRKPKRIIYYAHLPEVVRTPPSVDLRYRYSNDPYRRFDDDYARTGRYDYRFRNRYPYSPLRKEERRFGYRDLAGSGTVVKDKKIDEKVTPKPILPQKEDKYKNNANNRNINRNNINSHQYHEGDGFKDQLSHKSFQDGRPNENYQRYDESMFSGPIDSYQKRY